jgi:thioesterase domain-containing protein
VFGFCAGAALATRVADAVAGAGEAPLVVLFDAVPATGGTLAGEFVVAVESNARHLTAAELADARGLAEQVAADEDDLPRIAATLTGRYDQLMRAVAERLSVSDLLREELTGAFTAYLDYLLLASEGGFDMRTATPLFVTSPDHELPVQGARAIAVDVAHDDLLRDPQIHKLVAGLLTGEHPW